MHFAIVLFPDVEELDFAGPYEVLGMAAKYLYRDWRVFTVAQERVVKGSCGLSVNVDYLFDEALAADVILVPGGDGTRPGAKNAALMGYIERTGAAAQYVTSVCTGALLLHAAGFLQGRRATTYWAQRDTLSRMGGVEVVEERWVHDGNVITAAPDKRIVNVDRSGRISLDRSEITLAELTSRLTAARLNGWSEPQIRDRATMQVVFSGRHKTYELAKAAIASVRRIAPDASVAP